VAGGYRFRRSVMGWVKAGLWARKSLLSKTWWMGLPRLRTCSVECESATDKARRVWGRVLLRSIARVRLLYCWD